MKEKESRQKEGELSPRLSMRLRSVLPFQLHLPIFGVRASSEGKRGGQQQILGCSGDERSGRRGPAPFTCVGGGHPGIEARSTSPGITLHLGPLHTGSLLHHTFFLILPKVEGEDLFSSCMINSQDQRTSRFMQTLLI